MQTNAEFKSRFAARIKKAGDKADEVIRKMAQEIGTSLVMYSPVDTGRFRANWLCGAGGLRPNTVDELDKTGSVSIQAIAAAVQEWQPGQTIYITNSLPYANRLEYGWSQQAPSGMVRLTLRDFSFLMRKAASEVQ